MADKVKVAVTIPTATPIQYPIAKVAASTQSETANKFIGVVMSAPGQAVLKKHGFGK
jgi:molybdate transport system substrate-binding protein